MATYTLNDEQIEELLEKQKVNCFKEWLKIPIEDATIEKDKAAILNAPSPDYSKYKTEEIKTRNK